MKNIFLLLLLLAGLAFFFHKRKAMAEAKPDSSTGKAALPGETVTPSGGNAETGATSVGPPVTISAPVIYMGGFGGIIDENSSDEGGAVQV